MSHLRLGISVIRDPKPQINPTEEGGGYFLFNSIGDSDVQLELKLTGSHGVQEQD